jgi:hypothetical protein
MAHLDTIPPEQLRKVSDEISSLVFKPAVQPFDLELVDREIGPPAEESPVHLNPTMTIWKLKTETFAVLARTVPEGDLVDWVEPTNLLYHQIRFNDELVASARSWSKPSELPALAQIGVTTDFSSRVDETVKFIEQENESSAFMKDDPVARLLEIPSHQVFVIWLYVEKHRESRVVVVQVPEERNRLPLETFLTSQDLFQALHQSGPLGGVQDDA